jgi:tetratricopeptide (TPR) repeat protein
MSPLLSAALCCLLTSAAGGAEQPPRRAVLFVYNSTNEHDTLLDAQLTLELYPLKDKVSYWVSDAADQSAKETLAAYGLAPQELPVVLLLDRDEAQAKAVAKIPIHRPLGHAKNLAEVNQSLERVFGLALQQEPPKQDQPPPKQPKPQLTEDQRREQRALSQKARSLGDMHRAAGDARRAEAYYLWATRLDPTFGEPAYQLAHLYLALRQYARAVGLFRHAEDLDPHCHNPVLLCADFDDGNQDGWLVQRGAAQVVDGRLELRSSMAEPGVVGIQGVEPWRDYRVTFVYQDGNQRLPGRLSPSFTCAVRSTIQGGYWFRTTAYGAEIFKTSLAFGRYTPTQLMLTNAIWNDAEWHERTCEVTTLPNGASRMRWDEDGRLVGECTDRVRPYDQGALSFQTESGVARIDNVLVVRLD